MTNRTDEMVACQGVTLKDAAETFLQWKHDVGGRTHHGLMPDLEVLHFARDHRPGEQTDVEMRRIFGSPAKYYQRLGRAIEDPDVLETDPQLVYRLRRIRDARHSKRVRRTL